MLGEHMAVQVRRAMPHDEVVDLSWRESRTHRSPRTLHVAPEGSKLKRIELIEVDDMFTENHDGVAGVSLISHETKVRCLC